MKSDPQHTAPPRRAGSLRLPVTAAAVALIVALVSAAVALALALRYAPEYGFWSVPVASWVVLALSGAGLLVAVVTLFLLLRLRAAAARLSLTARDLSDLQSKPLDDALPAVVGHQHLGRPEFVPILQTLFRRPPDIQYICAEPLSGGYGGSTVVLVELKRSADSPPLPRSFVAKLGDQRDMAGEHYRFHNYVLTDRMRAPGFFRHAEWGQMAGIAYEFAGLDADSTIQGLDRFYGTHSPAEMASMIDRVYTHLVRAWYSGGQVGPANLYDDYFVVGRKAADIVGHAARLVEREDPYRENFSALEDQIDPDLKPAFCPEITERWFDPVALVRTWSRRELTLPVHRSVVHGDLHTRNVLLETGHDGQSQIWFIDFSHTGNGLSKARTEEAIRHGLAIDPHRGHTLRDFARLEADVKFVLTALDGEDDLKRAVAFEQALLGGGLALAASPPIDGLDQRWLKAWQAIRAIRRRAAAYVCDPGDLRPYYLSLLCATLPTLYYYPDQFHSSGSEHRPKRYALIAAGLLAGALHVPG